MKKNIKTYLNLFFIYSILGFLFENIVIKVSDNNFFNSGVLYGPWAFIYGIAIFFIIGLNKLVKKWSLPKWLEIILFYILACILMTELEYTGGMLIESIFHIVYWNYTNMAHNFGFYICLEISLFWGLFATLVNYLLLPITKKLSEKIPWYLTCLLMLFFVIDIIVTILN